MQYENALVWFRRDLRDFDHAALYHALKNAKQVFCLFVFDTEILDKLENKNDRRVEFIWESLNELKTALQNKGGDLIVKYGKAREIIPEYALQANIHAVFANRDYEPSAVARDGEVAAILAQKNIAFHDFKDQVIFEKDEVLTLNNKPYSVFTPYKNAHLKKLNDFYLKPYPVDSYIHNLAKSTASPMRGKAGMEVESLQAASLTASHPHPSPPAKIGRESIEEMPSLETMGFARTNLAEMRLPTGMSGGKQLFDDFEDRMHQYKDARNFPAVKGVSYLSVHLRFGTVSLRHLARTARNMADSGSATWLNELIWRDFYFQILHHNPKVAAAKAYKANFEDIAFPNNKALFKAWCEGNTGYPLIDAAMRQINQTGYMHNRLRMVAASFLVKDLLVDWRWGERYFAEHLIDFDFSANNGGWQWAASTGCDAQPWFRIFNPITQSEKFDAAGKFIRKYVPELANCDDKEIHAPWLIAPLRQQSIGVVIGKNYPAPIIEHPVQRALALDLYKSASANYLNKLCDSTVEA
ncbi:MAG: deoxyribodipyrimidine photo-lyase [Bdellovibrio sp.]|nr:deoxyribodipyrimidine photo-lyase [Methylotenera sp.]